MKKYIIEYDGYAYWIVDSEIPDGEVCSVDGALTRKKAEIKCHEWNLSTSAPNPVEG